MSRKCAACGFENADDATFCESCGAKIESFVAPPPPSPVMASAPAPASHAAPAPPPPPAPPAAAAGGKVKCATCGAENQAGSEFCDSCGARLSVAAPPAAPMGPVSRLVLPQGDEIRIDSYPRVFGRADFARVNKSEYVSRRHFEVALESGKYFITDTNSTNGTSLNSAKLTSKTELKDGDTIEVGGVITMTFKAG